MFVEYETLNKKTNKNASELFFRSMKKHYKGEEVAGPHMRNIDNLMYYIINNNEIYVSKEPIYRERMSSLIIFGRNHKEISGIKLKLEKLEKETELELKRVIEGN